jgi:hypothetical protein
VSGIGGPVIVLVTLLLIIGTIIFGIRRGTGTGLSRAFGPTRTSAGNLYGVSTFFAGITATVAVLDVAVAADKAFAGAQSIGITMGVVFAVLVVARWASGGRGLIVTILTEAILGIIGLVAAIPATADYFSVARDNSTIWPLWLSVVVFVLLVLAIAMSLLRTFLGVLTLQGVPKVGTLLAFFSAISLVEFFMQPFHLAPGTLDDGPWWWVPFAGVLVVIAGCLVSPQLVLAVGGVVLLLAQLGVMTTVLGDSRILMCVLLYVALFGVVWFLVKRVFLQAVLKVHGRSV